MDPAEVRLPDALAERLDERAQQLLPLGSLLSDHRTPDPAEACGFYRRVLGWTPATYSETGTNSWKIP